MAKKFYITTPIYYVNARPHIGHAYTTIACDAIARRQRLLGSDTYFLTGTDEHGQKIERAVQASGKTPQEFADEISGQFRALWDRMGLTYDDFIRTTSERHKKGVQALFRKIRDNGYIYKGTYTGQYCVYDELYVDAVGAGAPRALQRSARFHPSGDAAERSHVIRSRGVAGPVDQPFDFLVGHPGAG
jgi:methionyl-tRNA synthetase